MSLINSFSSGWNTDSYPNPYMVCEVSQNEWIPLFVSNDNISINEKIYYSLTIPSQGISSIKSRQIVDIVNYQTFSRKIEFPKSDIEFYLRKGLIYCIGDNGEPKILMCSVRRKVADNYEYKTFIDSDVFTSSKYNKITYYVKKYFIKQSVSDNSEMIITTKIMDKCFKPCTVTKRFDTVNEEEIFFVKLAKAIVDNELTAAVEIASEPEMISEPEMVPEVITESIDVTSLETITESTSEVETEILTTFGISLEPPTAAEFVDAEEPIEDVYIDTRVERVVNVLADLPADIQRRIDEIVANDSNTSIAIYDMLQSVESVEGFVSFLNNTFPETIVETHENSSPIAEVSTEDVITPEIHQNITGVVQYGFVDDDELIFRQNFRRYYYET